MTVIEKDKIEEEVDDIVKKIEWVDRIYEQISKRDDLCHLYPHKEEEGKTLCGQVGQAGMVVSDPTAAPGKEVCPVCGEKRCPKCNLFYSAMAA